MFYVQASLLRFSTATSNDTSKEYYVHATSTAAKEVVFLFFHFYRYVVRRCISTLDGVRASDFRVVVDYYLRACNFGL